MTEHGIHPGRTIPAPWQQADTGWRVWITVRTIIQAQFESQGADLPALVSATCMHPTNLRRLIKGQERYTLESFVRMCAALGLNPALVFSQAYEQALKTPATTPV